ncbi:DUF742 domain-containing protein [Amycolatopsis sp. SID8362]|uniref:DUF742 domain-containing protein n=1 Tax=Amycolatopsis sp. SID8362 TaxID=2690346 RepID=UPI001371D13E|nr:DUF742 domain-containing protein [Amycolatopsis sp. SID8362]NBH10396.1 DUF742 domain-containing protein [Amycolatopsis sp. SID8362]NED47091.1 DUF742 domain-containing protein [Amycolatopsis sp. SID8362]
MTDAEWWAGRADEEEPGPRPSMTRPYSWTEGRTQPALELSIEALVQSTTDGASLPYNRSDVRSVLLRLCRRPRSVAEIGAELSVPLGVARVLVSDLASSGWVTVRDTLGANASWDERHDLLERVLSGLHAI